MLVPGCWQAWAKAPVWPHKAYHRQKCAAAPLTLPHWWIGEELCSTKIVLECSGGPPHLHGRMIKGGCSIFCSSSGNATFDLFTKLPDQVDQLEHDNTQTPSSVKSNSPVGKWWSKAVVTTFQLEIPGLLRDKAGGRQWHDHLNHVAMQGHRSLCGLTVTTLVLAFISPLAIGQG